MQHSEIGFWIAQQPVAEIKALKSQVEDLASQVGGFEFQFSLLKGEIQNWKSSLLFLVGVLCALWAQNTGRNAWIWFFLGACFAPITAIVLLRQNSADLRSQKNLYRQETKG